MQYFVSQWKALTSDPKIVTECHGVSRSVIVTECQLSIVTECHG